MKTPIIASVTTYNPDCHTLLTNIESYYNYVEKIVIVDNSETSNNLSEIFQGKTKITIIRNNENAGIAKALNIAADFALSHSYQWLLTMDQDSSFTATSLESYLECFENIKSETIGMIGINYSPIYSAPISEKCLYEKKATLITSGSILNLAAFKKTGGFNNDLFIDAVDDEFCLRLNLNGFEVLLLKNIILTHALGKTVTVRQWLIGPVVQRNVHPPFRIYYMTRNYLYLIKKYKKDFPERTKELRKTLRNKVKNNILYHSNKIESIKYYLKGIRDFYQGKMGKLGE